jgi:hypothetical protein
MRGLEELTEGVLSSVKDCGASRCRCREVVGRKRGRRGPRPSTLSCSLHTRRPRGQTPGRPGVPHRAARGHWEGERVPLPRTFTPPCRVPWREGNMGPPLLALLCSQPSIHPDHTSRRSVMAARSAVLPAPLSSAPCRDHARRTHKTDRRVPCSRRQATKRCDGCTLLPGCCPVWGPRKAGPGRQEQSSVPRHGPHGPCTQTHATHAHTLPALRAQRGGSRRPKGLGCRQMPRHDMISAG